MDDMLSDAFERLLADHCDAAAVRAIERGDQHPLWQVFADSGFADTLLAQAHGGAGLSLRDAYPLIEACGRYAAPLPLAETMAVRAALGEAVGASVLGPAVEPLGIASHVRRNDDGTLCAQVPHGLCCAWVAVAQDGRAALWPVNDAEVTGTGIAGCLDATLRWPAAPGNALSLPDLDWRALGASLTAAHMAGAMARVLDMTLEYARQRTQFGRPIGKFQAIQQQISQLAERVFATRIAAQLAMPADGITPDLHAAAAAKGYASEAAVLVCSIAHAVHGAIGITAEHDLPLFTRRLHAWRSHHGAESYWYERLGTTWIDMDGETPETPLSALDFVRTHLSLTPA